MKKLIIMIVSVIIVTGLTNTVKAQFAANASANAGAKIISAITLEKSTDLNFGIMTAPTADVDVILTTGNTISSSTGNITFITGTGSTSNAHYNVTGVPDCTYAIILPTSATISKNSANPLTINTFKAKTSTASADGITGTLNAAGNDDFFVGATLKVPNGHPTGTYTGTFTVSVTYN